MEKIIENKFFLTENMLYSVEKVLGEPMLKLIDKLKETKHLTKEEWVELIEGCTPEVAEYLFAQARDVREQVYGKSIYIRGLIEFTNFCKNDCFYCGIRRSNTNACRYRLDLDEILECCEKGYELGFRTFVLQGGEDAYFTDDRLEQIVKAIRGRYPDCAITLSVGERSYESYKRLFDAGADRYLLRHETYNPEHYGQLHPAELSAKSRQQCLRNLKEIGYQVGCGFMAGSPYQTVEHLAEDMMFLAELKPHMVGIGPFISHKDTPFAKEPSGTLELTLYMLGLTRLLLPEVLLPATTALGTIASNGRELGIMAGANVVMPNLSPSMVREMYLLYNDKAYTGLEAAESVRDLQDRMRTIGYEVVVSRGDWLGERSK